MAMVASPSAAAAAAVPPPPPPSCPPPQFHVLAVDDSVLDRKLVESLLRTSSYNVTAVDSVTKALEFLGLQQGGQATVAPSCSSSSTYHRQRQEINLIITDYWMPGMTGYDLLKTVKGSRSPLRDIPVVIMSSENVPARINRCLEEGADEFFLKPVKLSDMSKLRPHILRGKSTVTKDDHEAWIPENSRGQELKEQVDIEPQQQQMLRTEQVDDSSDAVTVADTVADIAAIDSPRSNKRKVAQGSWDSHLQDQRTRTI